jgi:hypothetical protein
MEPMGKLKKGRIGALFPHQVAIPPPDDDKDRVHRQERILVFVREQGIQHSPHAFSVCYGKDWWDVYSFADQAEAEVFKAFFNGVWRVPDE